jgi:putative membrane protein
MDFILQRGFLGTNAPFFIDFSMIISIVLPMIMGGAIFLARKEFIKAHIIIQLSIFILATLILTFDIFAIFNTTLNIKNSLISYIYIGYILIFYIVWYRTIYFAIEDSKRRALPGLYSKTHKNSGIRVGVLAILNIFIGIVFYYLNFIN